LDLDNDNGNGYSATYPIEFMSRKPIAFDMAAMIASITRRLGRVKTGDMRSAESALLFLEDYPVSFKDGSVPAQLFLCSANSRQAPAQQLASIEQALQQSWEFRGASEIYKECSHTFLFANLMSSPLSHQVRRRIIANGLLATLETMNVDLLHWQPTQQMLAPAAILERYSDPQQLANPVYGFLNVRFFNISNSDGDMIMDTLGLNALGLTDFQIHFRELDPNAVARLMHNLGAYAFENGDVIGDGHTVEGPNNGRWKCRHEMSLLEPKRQVLDINPGPAFAAGNRS
jgi:hypothetical protein